MGIAQYIKEIGRGKAGARSLSRQQACDLLTQVLNRSVTDLEVGAFCLAMRVKGESTEEMLGFLDAAHAALAPPLRGLGACVVLPSYNGARKLPVLTPLLAALLARRGLRVLVHGPNADANRTTSAQVWQALGWRFIEDLNAIESVASTSMKSVTDELFFIKTEVLSPELAALLAVRRVVGVRNSAHSLVKLFNPTGHPGSVVVGSYTHPEYLALMGDVFAQLPYCAMLLRGTEGEPVADMRRRPQMTGFVRGARQVLCEAQEGSLGALPGLEATTDAQEIAQQIEAMLSGRIAVPEPIAAQVQAIAELCRSASEVAA